MILDEGGSLRERGKFPSSTFGREVVNVYQLSAENVLDASPFDVSLTLVFYTGSMSGQYKVYLLRIWQVGEKGEREIRAMLEDPRTHEIVGFSSLAELLQYLEKTQIDVQATKGQKPVDPYN